MVMKVLKVRLAHKEISVLKGLKGLKVFKVK